MLRLDVYLEGSPDPIGLLTRANDGSLSFEYISGDVSHPLSLSLPLEQGPFSDTETRGFFENLLFENAMREQVMQKYAIDQNDIANLLYHLGKDCPGAVSVVPEGAAPAKQPGNLSHDYVPLSEADLARIMGSLRDRKRMPDGTDDPSPLAGVQGKVALTLLPDGQFALPRKGIGAPTTHILKVPGPYDMRLVDHEHKLMQLAADFLDHPIAETQMIGDGDLRGLLITRYDREIIDGKVHRIHQEDFCQALGFGSYLKYQRKGESVQTFTARRVGLILSKCDVPAKARLAFFEGTILNLLFGNADNHAKNHSLLYMPSRPNRPQLAPFYDMVPTIIDSTVTHQLSFDIGAAKMTDDITDHDLESFAKDLGMRNFSAPLRRRTAELVEAVIAQIPQLNGPAYKRLGDAMAEQARGLCYALALELEAPERDLVVINRSE